MTATAIKKQVNNYLPLLNHKQQALILETIKNFLNAASVDIPEWQKKEVLKRQARAKNHPENLVDFDEMLAELEKELK
ncbi:MAG: addiction module protein [Bacteroidetes bacterium]|nr:addiction module protein [Bacteroidota bacterium]